MTHGDVLQLSVAPRAISLLHTLGACEWLRGLPFSSQFAVDKQDANKT